MTTTCHLPRPGLFLSPFLLPFTIVLLLQPLEAQDTKPAPQTHEALRAAVDKEFQSVRATRRESQWQLVPWRYSLTDALVEAKKQNKPVYMFLADGNMATGNC